MLLTLAGAPPMPLFGKFVYAVIMASLAAVLIRKDCNIVRLQLAWCGCGLIVVLLEYLPISRQDNMGVLAAIAGFFVTLIAFRLPMPWIDARADSKRNPIYRAVPSSQLPDESTMEHLARVVGKCAAYLLCGPLIGSVCAWIQTHLETTSPLDVAYVYGAWIGVSTISAVLATILVLLVGPSRPLRVRTGHEPAGRVESPSNAL